MMVNYRHVLVGIQLRSLNGTRLLERATQLQDASGRLTVASVIELGTFDQEREAVAAMLEEEYGVCSAHLARLCEAAGCGAADQRVLLGKAPAEIAAFARDHGCDLVVLGQHESRGRGDGLGSTAEALLRQLSCDVLVVRNLTDAG